MSADHGASHGGEDNTIWKAVGVGFIVLILINGQLSSAMTFALIAGVAAYFFMKKGASAGGHH